MCITTCWLGEMWRKALFTDLYASGMCSHICYCPIYYITAFYSYKHVFNIDSRYCLLPLFTTNL